MRRTDLLALTDDDLVTLSTRGDFKRAKNELENDKVTGDITVETDGTVIVAWSNDVTCILPPDTPLSDCDCDTFSTSSKVSRNLIRAVLLYRQWAEDMLTRSQRTVSGPWNPGSITDEELADFYRKGKFTRIKNEYKKPHVIEVVRSSKPTARIHTLGCTVRFLVPGDPRYTYCDCDQEAPCDHVPLAVRAFRELPATESSAIIETQPEKLPIPHDLLDRIHTSLVDLTETGLSGASTGLMQSFQQLEKRCNREGLIWVAATLEDIIQDYDRYTNHDSQFSPEHLAQLVGELLIRCAAIRNPTGAVPEIFVRGSADDKATTISTSRLIGLGCEAQVHRHAVNLVSYLQDSHSGHVVVIQRSFPDPEDETDDLKDFRQLAGRKAFSTASFHNLGKQQLLVKGGKRTASFSFSPPRQKEKSSLNPQRYAWEQVLRAPVLVEDFTELTARLQNSFPPGMRPRRPGEDFFRLHGKWRTASQLRLLQSVDPRHCDRR